MTAGPRGRTAELCTQAQRRRSSVDATSERLDVHNGLLLAAHLDAAFDAGLFTLTDDRALLVSDALDAEVRTLLTLDRPRRVRGLLPAHRPHLAWHRERGFEPCKPIPDPPPLRRAYVDCPTASRHRLP